jgi:hypothetical protein
MKAEKLQQLELCLGGDDEEEEVEPEPGSIKP